MQLCTACIYLQFLLEAPAADRVVYDEGHESHSRQDDAQHKVFWKQFTLNVAKGVAREVLVHG